MRFDTSLTSVPGIRFGVLQGVERASGASMPMQVFTRNVVGRFEGYASLATALTAAKRLSVGADKDAVAIRRRAEGGYDILEAVWALQGGPRFGSDRIPVRHFRFEDGSLSQYSAVFDGKPVTIDGKLDLRHPFDATACALVDGARIIEVA